MDDEVQSLLHRSIVAIRDIREMVGIPGSGTSADGVVQIFEVAIEVERLISTKQSQHTSRYLLSG